jgi:hypothetical protein
MSNFPFKGSPLDFDYILEDNGYKMSKDYETYVVFSKPIKINNNISEKPETEKSKVDAFIEVSRVKILSKNNRYAICSPYRITFLFSSFPLYAIRRLQWDTFPGEAPAVFDAILKVAEAESKICAYNFMETDIQITEKLKAQNGKK